MFRKVALVALGVVIGVAALWEAQHISSSAQPVRPAPRSVAPRNPSWSVYQGASRCVMSQDGKSVSCDNGYVGPVQ